MSYAVRVENLSKSYRISHQTASRPTYGSLREDLVRWARAPFDMFSPRERATSEEFWALKDVSFEVAPGEVLGIIGRNGAGKSTLLKVLSRITEPTSGCVRMRGRVGSLLEVGTGFHPELSGRENIFLSGAILGMSRREISRKFDEIVAFADIERFLDTPAKRYSSGMYMRLAFAVAAHLEPEILLVDEVLSVGDADFQKKCLGKMSEVAQAGRTVLFISHNMPAVTRLCPRTLLLNYGALILDGPSPAVVSRYLRSDIGSRAERRWSDPQRAPGSEIARLRAVRVRTEAGETTDVVDIRQPFGIEMEYEVLQPGVILVPNFHFFNSDGLCLFVGGDTRPEIRRQPREAGIYRSTAWLPGNFFAEGLIVVNIALSTISPVRVHFHEIDAVAFQVVDPGEGDSVRGEYNAGIPGVIRPMLTWTTDVLTMDAADACPQEIATS